MNPLSELFSYADTQKRKLGGLLSNPLETLALGATRFAEDQQASNNLMRNAYPMAGDRTVLNTPKQRGLLQGLFANEAANMGAGMVSGATVWRGPGPRNDYARPAIQDLISSQRYLDRDLVAKKIKEQNFNVKVTPKFLIDGENVRAITDGHHALEAAVRSGNKPNFITDTARTNDRIGLLKSGAIDDYLEAAYHDSPWYRYATKNDLF